MFESDDLVEIDGLFGKGPRLLAIARRQQSFLDQKVRTCQQAVSCEGGQALVRRVAISRWPERQSLPPALAGVVELIHPCKSGRPHVANSVGRGERCDVQ